MKINVKFRTEKLCAHLYYVPNIDGHNIMQGDDCVESNALKRNE